MVKGSNRLSFREEKLEWLLGALQEFYWTKGGKLWKCNFSSKDHKLRWLWEGAVEGSFWLPQSRQQM